MRLCSSISLSSLLGFRFAFAFVVVRPFSAPCSGRAARSNRAAHWERVEQVKRAISRGAAELMWSTEITTDYSLRWNADRAVWTTEDATSFDGGRFSEYARGTDVA
jgi:hypothetical protein